MKLKKKVKKRINIIIISVVVLIIAVVGFLAYKRFFDNNATPTKTKVVDKISDYGYELEEDSTKEKTTFKREFQTSEDKQRVANIEHRYNALKTLKNRRKEIYEEGVSPFLDDSSDPGKKRKLDTNIEKDTAWYRAVDEYIVSQTLDAIDSGNFDLFKDYLRDPEVKKVLENIGNVKDNPVPRINVEDIINRMDSVEKTYTDNLIVTNALIGDIENTPFEYVNIIARENTIAKIKADRINEKIKAYEVSAETNKFRFENSLSNQFGKPTLDYKTAVDLITATSYLKILREQKNKIESDDNTKNSIAGQMTINDIDAKIKTVTNYISNIKPALTSVITDDKIFSFINTIFATQQSLPNDSNDMIRVLCGIPGVGRKMARKLLDEFGTPGQVFKADDDALNSIPRIQKKSKEAIRRMR